MKHNIQPTMKASVPPRSSLLSDLIKALVSTGMLLLFTFPLVVYLCGPTLLWIRLLSANYNASARLSLVVVGTAIFQAIQIVLFHLTFLKPLYKVSRPGSTYARRYVTIYSLRVCQVFLSLLGSGPLSLLFLGGDLLNIRYKLQQTRRNMEAKILGVRPPEYQISQNGRNIIIPLRDGEATSATLYSPLHPDGTYDDSPRPVILIRTPYNRDSLAPWGARFAERGYHLVAQDTRGRFGSTGDFFPMLNEAQDGAATIEWIEQQSWCNGSVGITGVSYLGLASWAAMREQVPALKAVAPILAATDLHHVMFGRNNSGAAHVELMFRWSYLVIHLMAKPYGMWEAIFTFFRGTGKALRNAYMHAPLDEVDTKFLCPNSEPLTWFHDAFAHPLGTEEFWQGKKKFVDFRTLDKNKVPPVLVFAGWSDFFCAEQLHDYQDLSRLSDECRLVVGPFTHWCIMSMQPKLFRSLFDFFDLHLLKDPAAKRLAPVEVFEMGHDMGWRQFDTWPPPNVSNQMFVLSQGNDNELTMQPGEFERDAVNETGVEYVYDPADPTPQIGGSTFNPTNCGRLSQHEVEKRDDVLFFTSRPFEEPITIVGQIKVGLHVISSVEGTDYVARACHVTPDGVSENIADGIVRRFDLEPGVETKIEIELSPVMNRFTAGDRMRLHICSSAFPKHGRHLNTSDSFHLAVGEKVSKQHVILRGTGGSHVIIPILDK